MRVTFEPTNYTFTMHDNYFVQVIASNGVDQPFVAAFVDLHDAIDFAKLKLSRPFNKGVMVFSRTHQMFSEWKREPVAA